MAKQVKSFRLDVDLVDWVDGYATERGSTQAAVVEEALRSFKQDSEGGVPDLPIDPRPADLHPGTPMPAWTPAVQTEIEEARAEHARNLGVRQRALNARKERASR